MQYYAIPRLPPQSPLDETDRLTHWTGSWTPPCNTPGYHAIPQGTMQYYAIPRLPPQSPLDETDRLTHWTGSWTPPNLLQNLQQHSSLGHTLLLDAKTLIMIRVTVEVYTVLVLIIINTCYHGNNNNNILIAGSSNTSSTKATSNTYIQYYCYHDMQ